MIPVVRQLAATDVPEADRLFRLAFGTFLGLPDPQSFTGDADIVGTRWRANPAPGAGRLSRHRAGRLELRHVLGPVRLRRAGYRPSRSVGSGRRQAPDGRNGEGAGTGRGESGGADHLCVQRQAHRALSEVRLLAAIPDAGHVETHRRRRRPRRLASLLAARRAGPGGTPCRLRAIDRPDSGRSRPAARDRRDREPEPETILLEEGRGVAAFATCYIGKGSEAGTDLLFVKFAAVRPGTEAPRLFARLLDACEALAVRSGCRELIAGVNTARHEAYRQMIDRGFRAFMEGVAMLRPNEAGYNRPDCFVIDDLR